MHKNLVKLSKDVLKVMWYPAKADTSVKNYITAKHASFHHILSTHAALPASHCLEDSAFQLILHSPSHWIGSLFRAKDLSEVTRFLLLYRYLLIDQDFASPDSQDDPLDARAQASRRRMFSAILDFVQRGTVRRPMKSMRPGTDFDDVVEPMQITNEKEEEAPPLGWRDLVLKPGIRIRPLRCIPYREREKVIELPEIRNLKTVNDVLRTKDEIEFHEGEPVSRHTEVQVLEALKLPIVGEPKPREEESWPRRYCSHSAPLLDRSGNSMYQRLRSAFPRHKKLLHGQQPVKLKCPDKRSPLTASPSVTPTNTTVTRNKLPKQPLKDDPDRWMKVTTEEPDLLTEINKATAASSPPYTSRRRVKRYESSSQSNRSNSSCCNWDCRPNRTNSGRLCIPIGRNVILDSITVNSSDVKSRIFRLENVARKVCNT